MMLKRDHERLEHFCERNCVSPEALVEALEEMLYDGVDVLDPAVVTRAAQIDQVWSMLQDS